MIEEDNSIPNFLRFCAEILYHEVTHKEEKSSFESSYDELSDDEDNFSSEPKTLDTFDHFIGNISLTSESDMCNEVSKEKMSTADKLGMFTIHSMYSKGSVDVARGSRMSVMHGVMRKNRYRRMKRIAEEAKRRALISRKTLLEIEKKKDAMYLRGNSPTLGEYSV
jgi:hypothetical protein